MSRNTSCLPASVPEYKVVLLGEVGVGKTSLFLKLKNGVFEDGTIPTVAVDSCSKVVHVDEYNTDVSFTIWDTAGVERFRTLTRNYYRNANVAMLLYSVADKGTMHYLPKWVDDVDDYSPQALKVLIGNKCDLESDVRDESIGDFAGVYSCDCSFKMSVKTGEQVEQSLESIARKLLSADTKRNRRKSSVIINKPQTKDKQISGDQCRC